MNNEAEELPATPGCANCKSLTQFLLVVVVVFLSEMMIRREKGF